VQLLADPKGMLFTHFYIIGILRVHLKCCLITNNCMDAHCAVSGIMDGYGYMMGI